MTRPSTLPAFIRTFVQHVVQPMDQPDLQGHVIGIRWSTDLEAFELQLGSSDTWFHQDEIERAD